MRRVLVLVLLLIAAPAAMQAQDLRLPLKDGSVRFAVIGDTGSASDWKMCFFHHPLYSSGETHGSADLQREQLEPVFVKHGVNVVLTGHEHFYERIKPQKGIVYFIVGNSAKVRRGDLTKTALTEKGYDQGYGFVLMEVAGAEALRAPES